MLRGQRGAYRPDLHYMRGPGPKWHAKYGGLYPKTRRHGSSRPRRDLPNAAPKPVSDGSAEAPRRRSADLLVSRRMLL